MDNISRPIFGRFCQKPADMALRYGRLDLLNTPTAVHSSLDKHGPCAPPGRAPLLPAEQYWWVGAADWPGGATGARAPGVWQEAAG